MKITTDEIVLVNLDNGMVGVRSTNRDKVDETWAKSIVKDALRFYSLYRKENE